MLYCVCLLHDTQNTGTSLYRLDMMMPGLEAGMAPAEVVIATPRRREMGCINLGTLNCIPCITLSVLKWSSYHGGTWLYPVDVVCVDSALGV